MKIDIHTHTRKCKSGDAPTREISPENFCETILSTEVRIIAITNHNVFDLAQYTEIEARLGKEAQVWPGIELDVTHDGSRAHLLVIISPTLAQDFAAAVTTFTKGATPDTFAATIEEVLAGFDAFGPLYVAHYKQKKPSLSDEALAKLLAGTKNPACVIKEVTNSISAGIYISHGHASIYGSDIHDWAKYDEVSRQLPDLRLPVDSFEHFCLLLQKDPTTINTTLDKKTPEDLVLIPFDDSSILKVRVYDDINVIFGPKGTGKSCILKAIAKHYSENGIDATVYAGANERLEDIFDTRGKDLKINLVDHSISYCSDEIDALRKASEVNVTSVLKYKSHFASNATNRNAKKILLKDLEPEEESGAKQEFGDFNGAVTKTKAYLEFLTENSAVKKELTPEEHQQVTGILQGLLDRLRKREWASFVVWQEIRLMNSAIKLFRAEVERKSATPAKPITTGFRDYALNRITIAAHAAEIVKCVDTVIPTKTEIVGSLGPNKGELEYRTEFQFQTGDIVDSSLYSLTNAKKTPQKKFITCVRKIQQHAYADDLFQYIAELNEIEDVEDIKTVNELLLFKRYFALSGAYYTPSTGEASMVMLQKELGSSKDVYILDEPEKSLGNEYISEVIVPLIRERARSGKKVFISTHDANIAVRTLPYSSIYRCHEPTGYKTYTGNPFSNNLVNTVDESDRLDWKKISMKTLEGGEDAFGERGKIYGNDKS